jgi:predicted CoA-binding protein
MSTFEATTQERNDLLRSAKTVAIVGISDKPDRPSYGVAKYLHESSEYELYFVNPMIETLFGLPAYKSLADIPVAIDIVDVFRKPEDCMSVLESAIEVGAKAIWLQLGIRNEDVAQKAHEAGMSVVMDRCILIDHRAL